MSQSTTGSKDTQLARTITLSMAIVLVISSIIGSGVFKKVAPMTAELLSPTWVLAAWVAAGLVTLAGALSVAEVSGQITGSGGAYVFLREIYGKTIAFFFGWSNYAVIRTASVASIAYVFAESVNALYPLAGFSPEISALSIGGIIFPFANIGVKLLAMVKAQSYGSGLKRLAEFLEAQGVDYFGVAFTSEGVALRKHGIKLPILVLNPDPESYSDCITYQLEPTIFTFNQLDLFIRVLIELDINRYPIHVEVDTGMRRLGFEPNDINFRLRLAYFQ